MASSQQITTDAKRYRLQGVPLHHLLNTIIAETDGVIHALGVVRRTYGLSLGVTRLIVEVRMIELERKTERSVNLSWVQSQAESLTVKQTSLEAVLREAWAAYLQDHSTAHFLEWVEVLVLTFKMPFAEAALLLYDMRITRH